MKSKSKGFSLIEMLLVIGIIGIIASIGIPMMSSLGHNKTRLNYSTQQVMASIRTARTSAMLRHGTVYLVFDPNNRNRYTFFSPRTVGDQPGKKTPSQLSNWLELEDCVFFSEYHYIDNFNKDAAFERGLPQMAIDTNQVPSMCTGTKTNYPYLAFDSFGATINKTDVIIGLTMVSMLNTNDYVEVPAGNRRYVKVRSFMTSETLGDFIIKKAGDALEIVPVADSIDPD